MLEQITMTEKYKHWVDEVSENLKWCQAESQTTKMYAQWRVTYLSVSIYCIAFEYFLNCLNSFKEFWRDASLVVEKLVS